MCRLLGYVGKPLALQTLISDPPHSLVVQSYQPREMTAGLLNADGFGLAWYDLGKSPYPFTYRSELPIWNDVNLPSLQRYVVSDCFLAGIRSATPGQGFGWQNCPPYCFDRFSFIHNGFIENFRTSLLRPLRSLLQDEFYHLIHGVTDSEHIFALLMQFYHQQQDLVQALGLTIATVLELSQRYGVRSALNIIVSDGVSLVATRCASAAPVPSLYKLRTDYGVIVASEPLWEDERWQGFAPQSTIVAQLGAGELQIQSYQGNWLPSQDQKVPV